MMEWIAMQGDVSVVYSRPNLSEYTRQINLLKDNVQSTIATKGSLICHLCTYSYIIPTRNSCSIDEHYTPS